MNEFRKYLQAIQSHYSLLMKIMEQGNDAASIEHSRWATALIDDIIHHFDLFVKWENPPDELEDQGGPVEKRGFFELPPPPPPSEAVRGRRKK